MSVPADKLDTALFAIVRHLNFGKALIKSREQRHDVAMLNVLAGEKSLKSFTFQSAAHYLLTAISLHDTEVDDRDEHYDSLMNICNCLLEPLFVTGDFSALEKIVDKLLKLSRSFKEKAWMHTFSFFAS